jgi:hypothetical protein
MAAAREPTMRLLRNSILLPVVMVAVALATARTYPACAQASFAPSALSTSIPPASAPAPSEPAPLAPPPIPPPPPSTFANGVELILHPYLWTPGLNLAITTPLARVPEVNVSASAVDILGKLNSVPFMGAAELRYGPFGVLGDAMHLPLGVPVTTRNVFYSGGHTGLVVSIGTGSLLYRVVDQPVQTIDGGLGFRSWGVAADVILNAALLPTTSFSRSGGWTDPLIVGRYHRDLSNGFGLTAYGDVGGFGIGAHVDWQIAGTLDYALKPWWAVQLGYRSLNVNYQASGSPLGFNVHMKGPILATTIRF